MEMERVYLAACLCCSEISVAIPLCICIDFSLAVTCLQVLGGRILFSLRFVHSILIYWFEVSRDVPKKNVHIPFSIFLWSRSFPKRGKGGFSIKYCIVKAMRMTRSHINLE